MDCRCRKLSLFFCKFLSAVGVLEQDCRYIFGNFGAMSLVAKTPWKASSSACDINNSWDSWRYYSLEGKLFIPLEVAIVIGVTQPNANSLEVSLHSILASHQECIK